ncbi:NELL2-interacting cell ontogeny regulator 1 isoform X1 [Oryctolagus cuniculus]|uniref:NELL2-interacting cell ontogeny regulator 1 isoform X1 n=1 Tax=Oryctolagus cuniculus TaxID=9986 RepID=UPI002230373E|nr:neuropeptide-like protein C4orf48 homolog isoform X2 [Oryctolagus cuniculus]XP_051692678.1 neuropeptide-like protein C4orf48 homolog isoform X2 [Oryctolagus cuniculus]
MASPPACRAPRPPPLLLLLLGVALLGAGARAEPAAGSAVPAQSRPCVDCHAFEFMQRALQDLRKTAYSLDARTPSCCRLNAGPCAPAGPRGADHPGPALLPANNHHQHSRSRLPAPGLRCAAVSLGAPGWALQGLAVSLPHPGALPGLPCPEAGHGDRLVRDGGWGWGLLGG